MANLRTPRKPRSELHRQFPEKLAKVRAAAMRAISPIKPADDKSIAAPKFLFTAERTQAGRDLPPYYLVYFLLVELMDFRNLGQFEKIAWSVPIDLDGRAYLIEYRKMGLGVFAHDAKAEEEQACRIVSLIKKGVAVAEPFFEWLAERAVQESKLNVTNNCDWLFDRYQYLRDRSRDALAEAEGRKDERHTTKKGVKGGAVTSVHIPWFGLKRNARWLALAAIDAFFSWTEHVFIHLAILQGNITTGAEVAGLAEADWASKFKRALDLSDPVTKMHFDKLLVIRRQFRNFVAHGAFGKRGEAFRFHSGTGAVPVTLTHRPGAHRFSLPGDLDFEEQETVAAIEAFIDHLWSGTREPARIYLQESQLPVILTMACDGSYAAAMQSMDDMTDFISHLSREFDDAANMDW